MSEARPWARTALLGAAGIALLAAAWLDLRSRARDVTGRLDALVTRTDAIEAGQSRVERAVQLFRFERGAKGLGVTALLEHLRFWAPLLSLSTTPQRELPAIQERVDDLMRALEALGPDAFAPLLAAFRDAEPEQDDLRRWLLDALPRIDRGRGLDWLETCVRGIEVAVSPRIRVHAAQLLLEHDKARLGRILGEILSYESAAGIDLGRLTPEQQRVVIAAKLPRQRMGMFFNFIDLFAATGAPDVEEKLIMVAGRSDHDLPTIQACVKHLGDLRSVRAVKVLKRLFDAPPDLHFNPIFQGYCLDAIGKIEGAAACDYFKDMLRRGPDERVQSRLNELIKKHCR